MRRLIIGLMLTLAASGQVKLPRPAPPLNLLAPCKGKPTLLAWIVTTCPHCKAFTHGVMEPEYKTGHVCALAIAFNAEGDTARFAREQELTFPVYKLPRAVAREFMGITGPDRPIGTPQVVVIDKRGVIQAQSVPEGSPLLMQPDVIREILEKLK